MIFILAYDDQLGLCDMLSHVLAILLYTCIWLMPVYEQMLISIINKQTEPSNQVIEMVPIINKCQGFYNLNIVFPSDRVYWTILVRHNR